jgi:acyl carrier protein
MADATIRDIISKIGAIAADHFDSPGLILQPASTAADVAGWDSISHIQFLMRLEEELGIRFKTAEISGVRNVGELAERIAAHLK